MVILASHNNHILDAWGDALREVRTISIASTYDALKAMLANVGPACVALDRKLPPGKLIEAVRHARELNPRARIVLLSEPDRRHSDKEDLTFLKAGVCGFCRTDMDADMIRKVLTAVEQGQVWVQRRLVPALIKELSKQAKGAIDVSPKGRNL